MPLFNGESVELTPRRRRRRHINENPNILLPLKIVLSKSAFIIYKLDDIL